MLMGSAQHITGHVIASPVTLRQEGIAMPREHMNFDDGGYGGRKAQGKGRDMGRTEEEMRATDKILAEQALQAEKDRVERAKRGESSVFDENVAGAGPSAADEMAGKLRASLTTAKVEVKEEVKQEPNPDGTGIGGTIVGPDGSHWGVVIDENDHLWQLDNGRVAKKKNAGKAWFWVPPSLRTAPPAPEMPTVAPDRPDLDDEYIAPKRETEIERRRRIRAEAAAKKAAGAKTVLDTVKDQVKQEVKEEVNDDEAARQRMDRLEQLRQEVDAEYAVGDMAAIIRAGAAKAAAKRKAAAEEAAAKKARVDEEGPMQGPAPPPAAAAAPKAAAAGMQAGLQKWAEKVNAVGAGDPDLMKKCRDIVRKRILKAHATKTLNETDWDAEPVPTKEEIAAMP